MKRMTALGLALAVLCLQAQNGQSQPQGSHSFHGVNLFSIWLLWEGCEKKAGPMRGKSRSRIFSVWSGGDRGILGSSL